MTAPQDPADPAEWAEWFRIADHQAAATNGQQPASPRTPWGTAPPPMPLPEGARLPPGWGEDRRAEAEALWGYHRYRLLNDKGGGLGMQAPPGTGEWWDGWTGDCEHAWHLDLLTSQRLDRLTADRRALDRFRAQDRQPVVLVPASEVWDEPDLTYLVRGMVPDTGIGALFGARSTWKSFVALHLVLCVVHGLDFLGHPLDRPGWCFYLLGEGQRGARRRLRSAVSDLPGALGEAPGKLAYGKIPFALTDEQSVTELIGGMRAGAGREPVSLVVFDAAADFYGPGANENLTADMNPVIDACKQIFRELGCFVLLVAHTGYGNGEDPDHIRGTSRFGQAWDFEAQCNRARDQPGCGWLRISKSKEDEDGYSIPFRVTPTGAGSLAVRGGHDDGSQDAAGTEGAPDQSPHPFERLNATEGRILGDVIRYVIGHGHEDKGGLSFRRIDQGTKAEGAKGAQATKRQMLDLAVRLRLLELADQRYRLPDPGGYFVTGLFVP